MLLSQITSSIFNSSEVNILFTIAAEILARSLAHFHCQSISEQTYEFTRFDFVLSLLPFYYCKKQINISFSCVCPVIDNEFQHKIVKEVCGSTATLIWQFCDEIHGQYKQDRGRKNLLQFGRLTSAASSRKEISWTTTRARFHTDFPSCWVVNFRYEHKKKRSHFSMPGLNPYRPKN